MREEKIKILIVEDELLVAEEIKLLLEKNNFEIVGIANTAEKALRLTAEKNPNIFLLDVNIDGEIDGIELANLITTRYTGSVIFLTAYTDDDTISRIKSVEPYSYIVKPFEEKSLLVTIDLAYKHGFKKDDSDYREKFDWLYLKEGDVYCKIDVDEILYVEATGSYTKLITPTKSYTFSYNLKTISEKLNHPHFFRCHRSFIVNLTRIEKINGRTLEVGGNEIPLGNAYKSRLKKYFTFL